MTKQRLEASLQNKWVEKHPIRWKKYYAEYYQKNKKHIHQIIANYKKIHPELVRRMNQNSWRKIPRGRRLKYSRTAQTNRKKRFRSDPVYAKEIHRKRREYYIKNRQKFHEYYLKQKRTQQVEGKVNN